MAPTEIPLSPGLKSIKSVAGLMVKMSLSALIFCVLFSLSVDTKPIDEDPVCGYEACPFADPDSFNVHLIPHSHDDVGWLKTYEQYYFEDVQNVIGSVVSALKQNRERRYVQVETAYFKLWWEGQSEAVQQDVINLINNGQLEIINGAWSMNDEAAVHYQSTIDQFTFGLRYLEDRLGKCSRPRVGWQIDPFGHSREQASISAQLGFDSLFFARVDYRDKANRFNQKTMDLLWRGSSNLGNTSDIFTSVLYNHYSAPGGFCFDIVCNDDPIIDDEESPDYNYETRVSDFAYYIHGQAERYPSNNILVTMGDDFRYQAAMTTYINLDRLIAGFDLFPQTHNDKPIKVFYSTPSCYAKAVNDYANTNNYELSIKTDDFFPYADGPTTPWTGYFTSRPASKRFERQANNLLQVFKQLAVAAELPYETKELTSLKDAIGVMQHHDAITGTEKQQVTDNYHLLLSAAIVEASDASAKVLASLISGKDTDFGLESCLLANVSSCRASESDLFTVVAYNPLSRSVSSPISVPVDGSKLWLVLDNIGQEVEHTVEPLITDFSYITDANILPNNLVFIARDLPPQGYKVYQFQAVATASVKKEPNPKPFKGYEEAGFEIDSTTGLLSSVTVNGVTLDVTQDFLYYKSGSGSGAYIFVPSSEGALRIAEDTVTVTDITDNANVSIAVLQEFGSWAKQIIRVYREDPTYIELDWIIGPLVVANGKEVISRFTTSLKTESTFYTDSNGREVLKRIRNSRPDYSYSNEEPVSGNYYPVNSKIVLKDESQGIELAVLTDRSEGGSSLQDGQLELMVHRACPSDDGRGVGESLNEQQYGQGIVVRGKHFLVLGSNEGDRTAAAIQRDLAQRKLLAPWTFHTSKDLTGNLNNLQFTNLKRSLEDNVQILTLEPWTSDTVLLRLEHVLEKDEDPILSKDITVDLTDLFASITITELEETTLGANFLLEERVRLEWPGSALSKSEDSPILNINNRLKRAVDDLSVTLAPMQIRTFLAKYELV